jgi:hypothetical protein
MKTEIAVNGCRVCGRPKPRGQRTCGRIACREQFIYWRKRKAALRTSDRIRRQELLHARFGASLADLVFQVEAFPLETL